MRQWKNLLLVSCLKCVNVHGKCFFLFREDTEVFKADRNKLFASNEKQTDNPTLMLDMLHSNISVVCTLPFGVALVLYFSRSPKKLVKALNFNFYVHKASSKVEE